MHTIGTEYKYLFRDRHTIISYPANSSSLRKSRPAWLHESPALTSTHLYIFISHHYNGQPLRWSIESAVWAANASSAETEETAKAEPRIDDRRRRRRNDGALGNVDISDNEHI